MSGQSRWFSKTTVGSVFLDAVIYNISISSLEVTTMAMGTGEGARGSHTALGWKDHVSFLPTIH